MYGLSSKQDSLQRRSKCIFKQSFRGTKLVNGFEKSKHLEKLKLFV